MAIGVAVFLEGGVLLTGRAVIDSNQWRSRDGDRSFGRSMNINITTNFLLSAFCFRNK